MQTITVLALYCREWPMTSLIKPSMTPPARLECTPTGSRPLIVRDGRALPVASDVRSLSLHCSVGTLLHPSPLCSVPAVAAVSRQFSCAFLVTFSGAADSASSRRNLRPLKDLVARYRSTLTTGALGNVALPVAVQRVRTARLLLRPTCCAGMISVVMLLRTSMSESA